MALPDAVFSVLANKALPVRRAATASPAAAGLLSDRCTTRGPLRTLGRSCLQPVRRQFQQPLTKPPRLIWSDYRVAGNTQQVLHEDTPPPLVDSETCSDCERASRRRWRCAEPGKNGGLVGSRSERGGGVASQPPSQTIPHGSAPLPASVPRLRAVIPRHLRPRLGKFGTVYTGIGIGVGSRILMRERWPPRARRSDTPRRAPKMAVRQRLGALSDVPRSRCGQL